MTEGKLYYIGEGLLIIISILLAFAIDAWWAGAQEEQRQIVLRQSLADDFRHNQQLLLENRRQHETNLDVQKRFAELIQSAETLEDDQLILAPEMQRNLLTYATYNPLMGTLKSIVATGDLHQFENPDLRILLVSWMDLLEDYREEEAFGMLTSQKLVDATAEFLPTRSLLAGYGGFGITTPSKHDSNMQGLIASLEVENAVMERIISLNLVLEELTRLEVLLGEINAALAGEPAL